MRVFCTVALRYLSLALLMLVGLRFKKYVGRVRLGRVWFHSTLLTTTDNVSKISLLINFIGSLRSYRSITGFDC